MEGDVFNELGIVGRGAQNYRLFPYKNLLDNAADPLKIKSKKGGDARQIYQLCLDHGKMKRKSLFTKTLLTS
jgi:ABC-type spermidine/putrescine transport systems, ATPase components